MDPSKYKMAFTTGGLFFNESLVAIELYLVCNDWKKVRAQILDENLIQARTVSSAKRVAREICQRLELLTVEQVHLLNSGTIQEQRNILWVAVCKNYSFIKDFMVEVVREKFIRMDLQLKQEDYNIFFHSKEEWHDELAQLSESTRAKLKQVLFRIMRQAEIMTSENIIIPEIVSENLANVLVSDNPAWLTVFPATDVDIKGWL